LREVKRCINETRMVRRASITYSPGTFFTFGRWSAQEQGFDAALRALLDEYATSELELTIDYDRTKLDLLLPSRFCDRSSSRLDQLRRLFFNFGQQIAPMSPVEAHFGSL